MRLRQYYPGQEVINEHNDPNLAETPHYKEKQTILPHPISAELHTEKKQHTPMKRTHDGKIKKEVKKDADKSPIIDDEIMNSPQAVSVKSEESKTEAKIDMRKLIVKHNKSDKKPSKTVSDKPSGEKTSSSNSTKSHSSSSSSSHHKKDRKDRKDKDKHKSSSGDHHRSHSSSKKSHSSSSSSKHSSSSEKAKSSQPAKAAESTSQTTASSTITQPHEVSVQDEVNAPRNETSPPLPLSTSEPADNSIATCSNETSALQTETFAKPVQLNTSAPAVVSAPSAYEKADAIGSSTDVRKCPETIYLNELPPLPTEPQFIPFIPPPPPLPPLPPAENVDGEQIEQAKQFSAAIGDVSGSSFELNEVQQTQSQASQSPPVKIRKTQINEPESSDLVGSIMNSISPQNTSNI